MLALINKKTNKELVASIGMLILSSLIELMSVENSFILISRI